MGKILVTAIGSAAGDVVVKGLQKYGYHVTGTDIYPKEWLVNSYFSDSFYQVPRAEEREAFVNALSDICQKEKIQYIIPLTDAEVDVLNAFRPFFEEQKVVLCLPGRDVVTVCRDKRRCAKYVQDICRVIPEIDRRARHFIQEYPVICKRRDGRSSLGLHYIETEEQLNAFLEDKGEEYMIQPLIEGTIVTVDVIRDRSKEMCVVCAREELLRSANGLGITVKIFYDEKLEELCRDIAKQLDIQGCVNFEFIRDGNGSYYFMECNPRFSGGVKYSVLSGYDFVINHLRCYEGVDTDEGSVPREQIIVRRYEEYIGGDKAIFGSEDI